MSWKTPFGIPGLSPRAARNDLRRAGGELSGRPECPLTITGQPAARPPQRSRHRRRRMRRGSCCSRSSARGRRGGEVAAHIGPLAEHVIRDPPFVDAHIEVAIRRRRCPRTTRSCTLLRLSSPRSLASLRPARAPRDRDESSACALESVGDRQRSPPPVRPRGLVAANVVRQPPRAAWPRWRRGPPGWG